MEPVATGQAAKDYLSKSVNPTLLKGLTELCKQKPGDPVVSLCRLFLALPVDASAPQPLNKTDVTHTHMNICTHTCTLLYLLMPLPPFAPPPPTIQPPPPQKKNLKKKHITKQMQYIHTYTHTHACTNTATHNALPFDSSAPPKKQYQTNATHTGTYTQTAPGGKYTKKYSFCHYQLLWHSD